MAHKIISLHPNAKDLTGKTYGRLTAIMPVERNLRDGIVWLCLCVCGAEITTLATSLNQGNTRSCGCLHKEELGNRSRTHGMSGQPLYNVWASMIGRCSNPNDHAYADYGKREITVCNKWLRFESFYADMGECPSGKTLERIDNNEGYSPENCIWATRKQQSRNTRRNIMFELNGETMCLKDCAESLGINYGTVRSRLGYGWSVSDALTKPLMKNQFG